MSDQLNIPCWPDQAPCGNCLNCGPSDLLGELKEAEQANVWERGCGACHAVEEAPDESKQAIRQALGGTIGVAKLSQILTRHGYPVGRRAILRHRSEGHTP